MQIQSVNLYNKNYKRTTQTSFTSSSRDYYDPHLLKQSRTWGRIATTTWMFRQDLDWEKFINFTHKNFINHKHVNTYSLACSDGSEAYSFLISTIETLPKDVYKKFIPIFAVDRDTEIIKSARTGKINLSPSDICRINIFSKFHNKYFINKNSALNIPNDNFPESCKSYDVIEELRNKVIFNKGDLLTHFSKIHDSGNSIVFCRNVTPYMPYNDIFKLANIAGSVLKKGSLIVFGEFDRHSGILDFIDIKGFEECMEYVFRKI